jgi:hypothetical protein
MIVAFLKILCVWDDTNSMFGDVKNGPSLFLGDITIEIREAVTQTLVVVKVAVCFFEKM